MQYEIATAIAEKGVRVRLTRDQRRNLLQSATDDPDAYDLFIRARHFQMEDTEADYLAARELLQRAVTRDPTFADAWADLANTYVTAAFDNYEPPKEAWPEAGRCLEHALALNRDFPGAHNGLAARAFFDKWDWAEAEREFKLATGTKDTDMMPEVLLNYAFERWSMGHADESLALVRRARVVDPLSPIFISFEAKYLFHTQAFAEAAALLVDLVKAHPEDFNYYFDLADVLSAQSRFAEALVVRRQAHELAGDDVLHDLLAAARGEAGYRRIEREAVRQVELPKLERRLARGQYASPCDFARAYAQLGDKEEAFHFLDAAFEDHAPGLVFLNVDRAWDKIRDDARFRAAVAKVGLP